MQMKPNQFLWNWLAKSKKKNERKEKGVSTGQ
jgi:hypothetical protein